MGAPYFKFYPGDYLRDTSGLSLIEHGAYFLLLNKYYSQEGLNYDKPRLYRICGALTEEEQAAVCHVVDTFFVNNNGVLNNKRADEEISRRNAFLEEQTRKGSLGGRPVKAGDKPGVSRGLAGMEAGDKPGITQPLPLSLPVLILDPLSQEPSSSVDDFHASWNRICVSLPKCSKLTEKRRIHVKARMKEYALQEWENIFQRIESSPFLTGQNDRNWKADFDWITKTPDNAVKVQEGKYDNNNGKQGSPPSGAQNSKEGNLFEAKYKGIGETIDADER